jgi:hypothetical protein
LNQGGFVEHYAPTVTKVVGCLCALLRARRFSGRIYETIAKSIEPEIFGNY